MSTFTFDISRFADNTYFYLNQGLNAGLLLVEEYFRSITTFPFVKDLNSLYYYFADTLMMFLLAQPQPHMLFSGIVDELNQVGCVFTSRVIY